MSRLVSSLLFFLFLCLPAAVQAAGPGVAAPPVVKPEAAPSDPAPSNDAEKITAPSAIKSVTVYNERARVTREMTVTVPAGAHIALFNDLPGALVPDSLRVEGAAAAAVKLGGVSAQEIVAAGLSGPRETELKNKLEDLHDQESFINAEKSALAGEKRFLDDVTVQASQTANADNPRRDLMPDQWTGAAQAIHGGLADMLKESVQQDIKIRALERDIAQTQAELDRIGAGKRPSYQVEVPLEASAATKLTLTLSYQVPGARWVPLYDARLDTEGDGKLELIQYGSVSQNTGEDWKGVALILSTAQPERGASLTSLATQWIDAEEEGAPQNIKSNTLLMDNSDVFSDNSDLGGRAPFRSLGNTVTGSNADSGGAVPFRVPGSALAVYGVVRAHVAVLSAQLSAAEIRTGGFVSEYSIPGPSTVRSDGATAKLMVGAFATDSKLEIHVNPQLSTDAFFVARCRLKDKTPTLAGKVNLFRNGSFIGISDLPALRPGADNDLYFGVDDEVSVSHDRVKNENRATGVIMHDNVIERDFTTDVQSRHNRAMDFVVSEVIPVPRSAKAVFQLLPAATTEGWQPDENVKGLLRWSFSLKPQEKKQVNMGWVLSWPAGYSVTGL